MIDVISQIWDHIGDAILETIRQMPRADNQGVRVEQPRRVPCADTGVSRSREARLLDPAGRVVAFVLDNLAYRYGVSGL